ncbi:SDR family NAD(P)-dependent oxidoreductase, partial [Rhizobiaceae sp. 2RAB30]
MSDLKGKIAIVTGGGQGIGKAITLRLAAEGCKVAVFDLNPEAAGATAEEARAKGGEVKIYGVDISDQEAVNKAVAQTEAELGPVWLLVN